MKKTMYGLVKEKPEPGALAYHEDLPIPEIGDDEVLIKVRCAALCGTDIQIMDWNEWAQKRVKTPVIAGHEVSGDIVAVGKNVKDRKVGDKVSCETHIPCGECYYCKNGMKHMCKNMDQYCCTIDGAFSEYTKMRSDCTYVVGDNISYEAACMFEPMGAGVHGVEVAEVKDKIVLVSGCGPIGLTAVSACKVFGAKTVIACDIFDDKLELAKEMGADIVWNSKNVNVPEEAKKFTDQIGVDAAIDVSGAEVSIITSLRSVRAGGRMVCVGLPRNPVEMNLTEDLIYREVWMTGVSGRKIWETWEDLEKVLESPYYKLDKLIGGRYNMKDIDKAVDAVKSGAPGKMLLYP